MGKIAVPLIILVIIALIVIPQTFYTIDETQIGIVTRLGAFQREELSPGLRVKTPFIEQVKKFDKRLLRVDGATASLLTSDRRNLVIDSYARYRITDPLLFFQSLTTELQANARVVDIIASQVRNEVALDQQSDVISETREEIMDRVTHAANLFAINRTEAQDLPGGLRNPDLQILVSPPRISGEQTQLRGKAPTSEELEAIIREPNPPELGDSTIGYFVPLSERLGIEIVDVRIKRADFPPDVATSVYDRMEAERERIASGLRAEGAQRDAEIRADVDRQVKVILDTARGTAARLHGEGESAATKILATALQQDPEFYDFQRTLEAYKTALQGDTTVVLDRNSDLFKFLTDPFGDSATPTPTP